MPDDLDVYAFGRELLKANDLDPVYVVLWESGWAARDDDPDEPLLDRWLLAYWAFYHVGTACWITAGGNDYWDRFHAAAGSKEYPRSSERRHYRGENARKSVAYLEGRGVFDLFTELIADPERGESPAARPVPAESVVAVVKGWVGFGPWIAFKVADMLERLAVLRVEFDVGTAMYAGSPTEATAVLRDRERPDWKPPQSELSEWAVARVTAELKQFKAPPRYERPLGPQEAETILCKWKSYLGGHYEIGEDVRAVREGLLRFASCRLSQELLKAGTRGGLW